MRRDKRKDQTKREDRIVLETEEEEIVRFRKGERRKEKRFAPAVILLLVWIGVFFFSLFFVLNWQQWRFTPAWVAEHVSYNIENFYHWIAGNGAADGMDARFYQYLVIAFVGAGLAACGAVFQGSMKNIFAGPSSMGVMSGGTLGCLIYLLCFVEEGEAGVYATANEAAIQAYLNRSFLERYQQELCVLCGCLLSVALVLAVSMAVGRGRVSATAMIVSGSVYSAAVGNINLFAQYCMIAANPSDTRIEAIRDMMMGNFNGVGTAEVLLMTAVPITVCLAVLLAVSGKLNLLSLGEDEARAAGVPVGRYRILVIAAGTVITAVVVAFCGHVGFLGFMVPQVARKIAGPDMRRLLPVSMLTGAILLTLIFDAAYFLGMTDSMNVITSALGCVVMAAALLSKKGGRLHEA